MRIVLLVLLAVVVFMSVSAQNVGCCCDPVLYNGSLDTDTDCLARGFIFLVPPANATPGFSCSSFCQATLVPFPAAFCGDGVCQVNETAATCPADCVVPGVGVCDDPLFRAAPSVSINPVKGEKALNISVSANCPASHAIIKRCEGSACADFVEVAQVPMGVSFVDAGSAQHPLKWNTDYTYRVSVNYDVQGVSDPSVLTANVGDIECGGRGFEEFCLGPGSYDPFEDYLKTYGYVQYGSDHFSVGSFGSRVAFVFGSRFNKAWQCDQFNVLSMGPSGVSCGPDEVCVSGAPARCLQKEECGGFYPFGLFATPQACEGVMNPRYCFFDKSETSVDFCSECSPDMSCYDYKSEGACERNNCGVGACEWRETIGEVNAGVCVNVNQNNCRFCHEEDARNISSFFESCSDEKAAALSTPQFPCFYDRIHDRGASCDDAYCQLYTASQCGAPAGGIRLNADNEVIQGSNDPCNIGVCELLDLGALQLCYKNADGNMGVGAQDCGQGDAGCEKDYFPPDTLVIPAGVSNRVDELNIRVLDKISSTSPVADRAGVSGYMTSLCVITPYNSCTDASVFPIVVSSDKLLVKNLMLKDGSQDLVQLALGNNTVRFFSRDPANNVGVVEDVTFYACDDCQGPVLLNLSVSRGQVYEERVYTADTRPELMVEFDEPAEIAYARLERGGSVEQLSQLTPNPSRVHRFESPGVLNGSYNLSINGFNDKKIFMDPPGIFMPFIVDPSLAEVRISPADGAVVDSTQVRVTLNFTRPVILNDVGLVHDSFDDPYAPTMVTRSIKDLFSSQDQMRFSASVSGVQGGSNTIVVDAQGLNTVPVKAESSFFVSTAEPHLRLVDPSFGVTPYSFFNATVLTPVPASCRFLYDTPTPPDISQFPFLQQMGSIDGRYHAIDDLSIPFGANRSYLLHVLCDFTGFDRKMRSFELVLDPDAPRIVSAFAEPSVIAEQYYPNESRFVTNLKVQVDKSSFCKYSAVTSNFASMKGVFPGFGIVPKVSHLTNVTVFDERAFEYYVVCEGKNDLLTQPETIEFHVDTDLPLNVSSSTPVGFGSMNVTLSVVANKRVFCHWGEQPGEVSRVMGEPVASFTHRQPVTVSSPGKYTYYARCVSGTNERSGLLNITFFVDTTPPQVLRVVDNTTHPEGRSWWTNKLRVRVDAVDEESGIDYFKMTIREKDAPVYVARGVAMNATSEFFFITSKPDGSALHLSNGTEYVVRAVAVNRVGLESELVQSDGVLIDVSSAPPACVNLELDLGESDVDCGGECDPCELSQSCAVNGDCASNFCSGGVCTQTSCEDGIRNGWESDVDCGGKVCTGCALGQACTSREDCASNYCDVLSGVCADAPACADLLLSPGETDVDCGGACNPCGEGQNCEEQADCAEGLACDPASNTCTSGPVGDADNDGVSDDVDACLGTPQGETVDEAGCGLSQTFSLGDGIDDAWRVKYFECIECADASPEADPDRDGLSNREEYDLRTDPSRKDTDRDGWSDGDEVAEGFDPLNPESHPKSVWGTLFKWLLIFALVAGAGYGGYRAYLWWREREVVEKPRPRAVRPSKRDELAQLREFAKQERLDEKEWLPLKRLIEEGPLEEDEFEGQLERLRKLAKVKEDPLTELRYMLRGLPKDARRDLAGRFKLLRAGVLDKQEREELFKKLKLTSKYYEHHKDALEKELRKHE